MEGVRKERKGRAQCRSHSFSSSVPPAIARPLAVRGCWFRAPFTDSTWMAWLGVHLSFVARGDSFLDGDGQLGTLVDKDICCACLR